MISRALSLLLLAAGLAALPASAAAARKDRVTPAGWAVRPAGAEISVAKSTQGFQGPLGSALSPVGPEAAVGLQRGDAHQLRRPVRPPQARRTGTVRYDSRKGIGEAVFYGVVFSPGGKRAWASGGGQNVVHVYDVGKRLRETGQIPTPYFPAGLAYGHTPRGDRIYVANNLSGVAGATNPPGRTVTVIDPKINHVDRDHRPRLRAPALRRDVRPQRAQGVRDELDGPLGVGDRHRHRAVRRRILLSPANRPQQADHPNAIAANPRRNEVYTANGNSDTVSVIDTKHERVVRTMAVGLARGVRTGSMPNGLAVSPDGKRLYVALGGENALAVLDLVHRKRIGFIPTAWNPTDVDITRDGKRLAITTRQRRRALPPPLRRARTRSATARPATTPTPRPPARPGHQGRHQRGAARRGSARRCASSRASVLRNNRVGRGSRASRRRSGRSATSST